MTKKVAPVTVRSTWLVRLMTATWELNFHPFHLFVLLTTVVYGLELDDSTNVRDHRYDVSITGFVFLFSNVVTLVLLWAAEMRLFLSETPSSDPPLVGWVTCLSYAIANSALFLTHVFVGNHDGDDSKIVEHNLIILMLAPFAAATCTGTKRTVAIWAICFLCMVIASIVVKDLEAIRGIAYYVAFSGVIVHGRRRQNMRIIALQTEREMLLHREREDAINANQINMRHMVANVAHDLKTPLSSFVAGIDIVSELVEEGLTSESLGTEFVREMLSTTQQCIRNMRNTNNFMLMTINRCIDYTKASKGLKLTPRYETIDLVETLSLPLHCMKDIQNRLSIYMLPIPGDICSHVITDKQWLQENLLCLLSNAVKYSNAGQVTVNVFLLKDAPLPRTSHGDADSAHLSRCGSHASLPSFLATVNGKVAPSASGESADDGSAGLVLANNSTLGNKRLSRSIHSVSDPDVTRSFESIEFLRIEVEDTGIGMTEVAMTTLFSPFQQNQRLAGGTGLGLFSLAKRVEALYGKCGVSLRKDGTPGSLFWFQIPYKPDLITANRTGRMHDEFRAVLRRGAMGLRSDSSVSAPDAAPGIPVDPDQRDRAPSMQLDGIPAVMTRQTSLTVARGPPPTRSNILLVEDSPAVQKMTQMLLRRHGFEVTIAENGAVALDLIRARLDALVEDGMLRSYDRSVAVFDFILMDLQMPVLDGLETTKRLREMERRLLIQQSRGSPNALDGDRASHVETPSSTLPSIFNNFLALLVDDHKAVATDRNPRTTRSSFAPISLDFPDTAADQDAKGWHHIVIGVTANDDDETKECMSASGFDAVLPKPFSMTQFFDVIDLVDNAQPSRPSK